MATSHILEEQLGILQLLQAMYPLPSELELSSSTLSYLSPCLASTSTTAVGHLDLSVIDPSVLPVDNLPDALEATLRITCDSGSISELLLVLPLQLRTAELFIRQSSGMSRVDHDRLAAAMPVRQDGETTSEYIMVILDYVRATAPAIRPDSSREEQGYLQVARSAVDDSRLERVWFWFPSLSTKEKRRDLVEYAKEYHLYGFVLAGKFEGTDKIRQLTAGKPGLLCVEGDGRTVDRYMAAIKSESWGDIPSYQKKVTERLRRPLTAAARRFTDMREITHLIPQHGQYNHRGDMSEVRRLMDEWGVGDDFGAVVMNASS